MRFNKHSELEGRHSFMSPSKPAWLRYSEDKVEKTFNEHLAHLRGTKEHAFAASAIELGHKLPDEPKTLNLYINDSIGWRMKPEVPLYWSRWCFGTADAVGFTMAQKILRISDLKTGKSATTFDQLKIYAGLFCLEYEFKPWDLNGIELRIYQSNRVKEDFPEPEEIFKVMDSILTGNRIIEEMFENYNR